jgi:hypothetical protein
MRALLHHYRVELQHLSPNAISNAVIFAAVCEGYLGVMPHWELWLHHFWGELFHAPSGTARVRKPVRAGCLNLVQRMGRADEPREYIPTGLMSNHAQCDSQWFYLRNDDGLFPAYTRQLIEAHPDNWNYGVIKNHQSRLCTLLDTLRRLCEEGLAVALVLSVVHHRRVLPLMA